MSLLLQSLNSVKWVKGHAKHEGERENAMADPSFEDLCLLVAEASSPDEIFSSLRLAGRVGWEAVLREEFEQKWALADPSQFFDVGARQGAEIVRRRLQELYLEAMGERPAPVVEPPWQGGEASFSIRTTNGAYEGTSVFSRGDLATLYEGRIVEGDATGQRILLKIADETLDNEWILDEAAALSKMTCSGGPQCKHLPKLFDQFRLPDGRAGTVLEQLDAVDLLTVRERYQEGVPLEHTIWILRRILSALGYAHRQGILHGNLEPSHILVRARDHNIFLVDWCYSLIEPAKSGRSFKCKTPHYSAPEVGERKPPIPASDLFSVSRCVAFLLGGDPETGDLPAGIDPRFARLIRHMGRISALQRAQDAWGMFDEVGRVRQAIFGRHAFKEFII